MLKRYRVKRRLARYYKRRSKELATAPRGNITALVREGVYPTLAEMDLLDIDDYAGESSRYNERYDTLIFDVQSDNPMSR